MNDLSDFRTATRVWLEANCPHSMRQPVKDPFDVIGEGGMQSLLLKTKRFGLKKCLKRDG